MVKHYGNPYIEERGRHLLDNIAFLQKNYSGKTVITCYLTGMFDPVAAVKADDYWVFCYLPENEIYTSTNDETEWLNKNVKLYPRNYKELP